MNKGEKVRVLVNLNKHDEWIKKLFVKGKRDTISYGWLMDVYETKIRPFIGPDHDVHGERIETAFD